MQVQANGGEFDPETGTLTLKYRDISTDPMSWEQKADITVTIPSEFVTYVDLTQPPPEPEEEPSP